jgi:hypothetical protein
MKRTPLAPLDHSHKSLGCVVGLGCIIWLAFYGGVLALIACGILFLLGVLPL